MSRVVEEASHTWPQVTCFHLNEMSTTGKCIEIESRLVVPKGWGRKEWGLTAYGCRLAFRGNENVQKLDSAFLTATLPVHKSL